MCVCVCVQPPHTHTRCGSSILLIYAGLGVDACVFVGIETENGFRQKVSQGKGFALCVEWKAPPLLLKAPREMVPLPPQHHVSGGAQFDAAAATSAATAAAAAAPPPRSEAQHSPLPLPPKQNQAKMSGKLNKEVQKVVDRMARNDPTMTEANLYSECAAADGAAAVAVLQMHEARVRGVDCVCATEPPCASDNQVADAGAAALAGALEKNTTLLDLVLLGEFVVLLFGFWEGG